MASNGDSDFESKYTNANMARDATPYDPPLFRDLVRQLEEVDGGSIKEAAPGIIAAMLCAQHRGDSVPKLFRDLTVGKSAEDTRALFVIFRQAITLIWPFVGLPQCVPASLGLVGELRQLGIGISDQMDRPLLNETDWHEKGLQTRKTIYRTAANSEVMDMMSGFFPELTYATHAVVFGFIIGGSEKTQRLALSEITIAGAIAALGATRQTRTHFKGSMGLGIPVAIVQAVLRSAERVAAWNGNKLPGEVDVAALAEEVGTNLGSLDNA